MLNVHSNLGFNLGTFYIYFIHSKEDTEKHYTRKTTSEPV